MNQLRILVVDDEPAMREVLATRLAGWGHLVSLATCGAQASALLGEFKPDVVISDLVLPDTTGIELLPRYRAQPNNPAIFIITAYGTIDRAVDAIKGGAVEFLTKPLDYPALKQQLEKIANSRKEIQVVPAKPAPVQCGELIGSAPPQQALYELIHSVAATNATALIVGESGTGKELVARTLHSLSGRSGHFVAVNSAAIPAGLTEGELLGHAKGAFTGATEARAGLFEQADLGTLFLDEITEMPLPLQAKLLRVIESGAVRRLGSLKETQCDVRIVAATNRDPEEAVSSGLLRPDIYYRLNVVRINVPALRERREDIPELARHFISAANQKHQLEVTGLSQDALSLLAAYHFPGNVRELKNLIERGVLLTKQGVLEAAAFPFIGASSDDYSPKGIVLPDRVTSAEAERILILETLKQTRNNKAEAARRLGLDVKTIRNKLRSFEPHTPFKSPE